MWFVGGSLSNKTKKTVTKSFLRCGWYGFLCIDQTFASCVQAAPGSAVKLVSLSNGFINVQGALGLRSMTALLLYTAAVGSTRLKPEGKSTGEDMRSRCKLFQPG